jgi:hypothetical protein
MAITVRCPGCQKQYTLAEAMVGRGVRCKGCGQTFQVSQPTSPSLTPAPQHTGIADLLNEDFGTPSSGPDLAASNPFSAGTSRPRKYQSRRSQMSDGDLAFLMLGGGVSLFALGLLFVGIPVLGLSGAFPKMAAFLMGMLGGASLVFGLRSNLPVALPIGGVVMGLLLLGLLVGPTAIGSGEASLDLRAQMNELIQLADSIQDEASLQDGKSRFLKVYSRMLKNSARLEDASNERRQEIQEAVREFDSHMTEFAIRLPQLPGGPELACEVAEITAKASKATAPSSPQARPTSGPKKDALKTMGRAFFSYHDAHKGVPPDWESFLAFLKKSPGDLAVIERLHVEGLVAQWGVPFQEVRIGTSNFVLAYEKDALETGGWVLMMDGSVHNISQHALRDKLNAQAEIVLKATGVAPPSLPEVGISPEETLVRISTWVPSGWSIPAPPEPQGNREARDKMAVIYVHGIKSKAVLGKVMSKLTEAQWGYGITGGPPEPQEPSKFKVSKVQDIRDFARALDLGPITEYDEARGLIRLHLDPAKLIGRQVAVADGGSPAANVVQIPRPPEPEASRDRRNENRKDAGFEPDEIQVIVQGVPDDETARQIGATIMRLTGVRGTQRTGTEGTRKFLARGAKDMRLFASELNVGPIHQYDERRGVIVVRFDPSRLAEALAAAEPKPVDLPPPPESAENRAARQAAYAERGRRRIGRRFGPSDPDTVEIHVEGASEATADRIREWIGALTGKPTGFSHSGNRWTFQARVEDIRVFAARLNLGPIMRYEEEKGILGIELEPSKLSRAIPEPIGSSVSVTDSDKKPSAETTASQEGSSGRPFDPRTGPGGRFGGRVPPLGIGPQMGSGGPGSSGAPSSRTQGNTGPRGGFRGGMPTPGVVPPPAGNAGGAGKKGQLLGGAGGQPFHEARAGQHVVGFRWSEGMWAGKKAVGRILPVYDRGRPSRQLLTAKDGYVVGGLVVDASDFVFAVKAVFVRLNPDGSLNSNDTYTSEWIGAPSGGTTKTLDAKGAKVIGIHGRGLAVVDAIGLVTE